MNPSISVVVIGYNIEQYISQCLESVLAQDYNNFELIFVDDGSKDNTLSAAQKFSGDPRVKIIHKENGGCVSARKAGVREAQGEYICFVDGDDWLNPDMLTNLVGEINSHDERVDIVGSRFFFQNPDKTFHEAGGYEKYTLCRGDEFFRLMMSNKIFHSVFPKLYRREFVINAGYLDYANVSMGEDMMTNCLFALHNPFVVFSQSVNYYYRHNTESVSRKSDEKLLEIAESLSQIEKYIKFEGNNPDYNNLMKYQYLGHLYFLLFAYKSPVNMKIKMFEAFREKVKSFRNNKYCLELWRKTRFFNKLLFTGYEKCPHLMYVFDPAIILLRKCVTALRLSKNFITRKATS